MSFLDKIAAAVTPTATDQDRAEARQHAQALAQGDDWLGLALQHHRQIETGFDEALRAQAPDARLAAFKRLETLLAGHSNAEEAVLYPAIVEHSGKGHATMAYEEQAMAKINMALLEQIDPASDEWREKLEHLQGAVLQHIYQEESEWFPDVSQRAPAQLQLMLTQRFREEFERYAAGARADRAVTAVPLSS